jgi:hypothetical protein
MLTQMKRWGQIKGDVDYKSVAACEAICAARMSERSYSAS